MEVLQSCPLFSGLTDAQIRALLEDFGGVRRKIKKGEEVPSHRLGLLLSGQLFIRGRSIDNRVYALNRIYPGAAFGAASLFLEDIELSSIFAEKSSEVILFAPERAWAMLQSSPRFCQNYIRFLCGRIAFLNRKIETLSGHTAESKLLSYLQREQQGGVVKIASFRALADQLGISRASLYRAMDALAAAGQLERQSDTLSLLGSAPD